MPQALPIEHALEDATQKLRKALMLEMAATTRKASAITQDGATSTSRTTGTGSTTKPKPTPVDADAYFTNKKDYNADDAAASFLASMSTSTVVDLTDWARLMTLKRNQNKTKIITSYTSSTSATASTSSTNTSPTTVEQELAIKELTKLVLVSKK